MRALRKILRFAHTWLTVAALLVAGAPHYRCVCPDGRVKPFCLNLGSGPSRCCCGGTCCPGNEGGRCCCRPDAEPRLRAGEESAGCCDSGHMHQSAQPAGPHPRLHGTACTKTATGGALLAVASERVAEREGTSAGPGLLLPPAAPASAIVSPSAGPGRHSWRAHQLPPPPDLIIVLQRLTI